MRSRPGPQFPERREHLLMLTAGPILWSAHFLVCYVAAAIWCEKLAPPDGSLGLVRPAIAVVTVLALAAIAAVGLYGYRRHRMAGGLVPHREPSDRDRHRFLGFSTLLLAGLSFVATIYVALPALFMQSCR